MRSAAGILLLLGLSARCGGGEISPMEIKINEGVTFALDFDMPFEKDGKSKVRLFQAFFLTNYKPDGYLGIQRMRSHVNGGTDSIHVFFAGFKGIHAGLGKDVNLAEGRWHNIVMTWDPMNYKMYIDGEVAGLCTADRKITDDELSSHFSVCCPEETMLDEIFVYDYVLPAETVKEIYEYLKIGNG